MTFTTKINDANEMHYNNKMQLNERLIKCHIKYDT